MIITDLLGSIEWVNPAFAKTTGFTISDATNKRVNDLLQGRDTDHTALHHIRQCLAERRELEVDILGYYKQGHSSWQRIRAEPTHDDQGCLHWFVWVQHDITEQKAAQDMVWRSTNCDAITGLPNDRLFRDLLQREIRKSALTQLPFALLFIDLDRFKEINDTYTPQVGDHLLRQYAQRIKHFGLSE